MMRAETRSRFKEGAMGNVEWLNECGDFDEWRAAAETQWWDDYGADAAYDREIDDAMNSEREPYVDERE